MIVYRSWQDRLFSFETVDDVLIFANLGAMLLFAILMHRRFPIYNPYFGELFILALCPFIFTAIIALLRVNHVISYEDWSPDYVADRLRPAIEMVTFGWIASTLALTIFSLLYLLGRRRVCVVKAG
jgi:hypothetical protein